MEVLQIIVDNKKNLLKIASQLKKMTGVKKVKTVDSDKHITALLSQKSFSEEWNSKEDARWDKLL